MPIVLYDLIKAAASHYLMGEYATYFGATQVAGTSTILSDQGLVSFTGDRRWANYHAIFPNRSQPNRDRMAYSTNLAAGEVQWMYPMATAPQSGEEFWLVRDFSFSQWSNFANDTARSLFFEQEVALRGATDQFRYSLPTPISRGQWVQGIFVQDYPQEFSQGPPPRLRWHRLNAASGTIQGDIHLLLEATIDASQQLVFQIARPYAHVHQSAWTMTRSVLTPFGETTTKEPPLDIFVLGMVWRALREKVRNLTGEARTRWKQNLDDASRTYAETLVANGVKTVAKRELGFSEPYLTPPQYGGGW